MTIENMAYKALKTTKLLKGFSYKHFMIFRLLHAHISSYRNNLVPFHVCPFTPATYLGLFKLRPYTNTLCLSFKFKNKKKQNAQF